MAQPELTSQSTPSSLERHARIGKAVIKLGSLTTLLVLTANKYTVMEVVPPPETEVTPPVHSHAVENVTAFRLEPGAPLLTQPPHLPGNQKTLALGTNLRPTRLDSPKLDVFVALDDGNTYYGIPAGLAEARTGVDTTLDSDGWVWTPSTATQIVTDGSATQRN